MHLAKYFILSFFLSTLLYAQTDPKWEDYLAAERANLPVDGELLYDGSSLSVYRFGGTKKSIDVDPELPFGKALQLSIARQGNNPWEPQLQTPANDMPLNKGDLLFYIIYTRVIESEHEKGYGQGHFYVQRNSTPWTGLGSLNITMRPEWQKYYIVAKAEETFDAGTMEATIHLGYFKQKVEIGGLIALNLGQGIDERNLPTTPLYYDGMDENAAWRTEAQARIEQHRKGDLNIMVKNQNGEPIKNAVVKIEMQKHEYQFGSFLSDLILNQTSEADMYRDEVLQLFNCATTPFYMGDGNWGWYHSDQNKQVYKGMAEWLQEQQLPTKGHVLIWPSWNWMPPLFQNLADDPEGLREAIDEHLDTIVPIGKERGLVQWDVVNEPHVNHDVMDICGDDIMIDWYKRVNSLHPEARLILNEYNIIMNGGVAAHQDDFDYYIKLLLDGGAPLGGIGMQCHFDGNLTGIPEVLSILDRFAQHNLPIQITEFDIDILDEDMQAKYTRDFYTAVFSHPMTDKIIMWGFYEPRQWKPNGAMIRSDWSYKPNYHVYNDLIYNQWWTNEEGASTREGLYHTRGFLGDYKITVEFDGHSLSQETQLGKDGATLNFDIPTTETGVGTSHTNPVDYGLQQNYPNPFNASTVIEFTPEYSGDAELVIYDTRGVQVFSKKLNVSKGLSCREELVFDRLSTGNYFYSINIAGEKSSMKKMMLVK
jgi:endo-1,4-beta-xylanase